MGDSGFITHRVGGALLVQISGVLTRQAAFRVRSEVGQELEARPAVKVLVDMRRAALLLAPSDLIALVADALVHPMEAPIAWLVDGPQESTAWAYFTPLIDAGYTRAVFTSPEQAQAWVRLPVPTGLLEASRVFEPVSGPCTR